MSSILQYYMPVLHGPDKVTIPIRTNRYRLQFYTTDQFTSRKYSRVYMVYLYLIQKHCPKTPYTSTYYTQIYSYIKSNHTICSLNINYIEFILIADISKVAHYVTTITDKL